MRNSAFLSQLAASAVIFGCVAIAPRPPAKEPTDETNPDESIDEIGVTGSHLSRSDYNGRGLIWYANWTQTF